MSEESRLAKLCGLMPQIVEPKPLCFMLTWAAGKATPMGAVFFADYACLYRRGVAHCRSGKCRNKFNVDSFAEKSYTD